MLPKEPQSLAATNDLPGRRALRLPVFFIGWTIFAASATWWLIHSANAEHLSSQLLFDSSQNGQIPISDQIRRWLKIADLSLRGAYPWLLLAPYVVWLASRLLLERGRLRVALPVHLLACGLFAIASQMLTTHSMAKRNTCEGDTPARVYCSRRMIEVSLKSNLPAVDKFLTNLAAVDSNHCPSLISS